MAILSSIRSGVAFLGLVAALIGLDGPAWAQVPKRPAPKPAPRLVVKPPQKAAPQSNPEPAPPPPPPPEDVTVRMRHVSGDKTTTSTLSMKGRRQRIDYGADLAVI